MFTAKNTLFVNDCIFDPPFGDLWVTIALCLQLAGKSVVNFPLVITELHTQLL